MRSGARQRSLRALVGGALLGTFAIASAAPLSVADAFKTSPIVSMRLSGDGKHLATLVATDETSGILVIDLATMKPKVLRNAGWGYPNGIRWLGKDVLVVSTFAQTHLYDGEGQLLRLVDGRYLGSLPPDADGHERIVVRADNDYIERVDIRTGASTKIPFEWPDGEPVRWLMDREGVPRVVTTASRDYTVLVHWVRSSASAPWKESSRSSPWIRAGSRSAWRATGIRSSSSPPKAATRAP